MTSSIDLSELNRLQAVVEDSRALMREAAKKIVKEGVEGIFDEYGDIVTQFGWTQYTPYFNDGEECIFSMNPLSVIATADLEALDANERDDHLSDWSYEGSPSFSGWSDGAKVTKRYGDRASGPNFDQRYQDALDAIESVYNVFNVDDRLAKDIFGDHVQVIFTAEGVEAESYDHD